MMYSVCCMVYVVWWIVYNVFVVVGEWRTQFQISNSIPFPSLPSSYSTPRKTLATLLQTLP
ncbi:hypothetical protein EON63_02090 [archaeon]|nr:MAG: hypothetical protein EON63_02090 [archaeon]